MVWIGGRWWAVIGILDPVPPLSSLDTAAFIGFDAADDLLGHDGKVSTIYVRMDPKSVEAVRSVLAAPANPSAPNEVSISRPSDALKARAAVDSGLRALLLALGGVGGVGLGCAVTAIYARRQNVPLTIAFPMLIGGVAAALVVGAIAGLYPATRAARLDPAEALRPA